MTATLVYTTSKYEYMLSAFREQSDFEIGVLHRKRFPNGELHLLVEGPVWGREVVLIGGFPNDQDFMELIDTATLLAERGARSLRIFIPYFGYGTQERATKAGECRTAKTRARILSGIPARGGCTIYLMDAHTEGLIGYFEGNTMAHHLYCEPAILSAMRDVGGDDFVVGSGDEGRVKWIRAYIKKLGKTMAIIVKEHFESGKTEVAGFFGNVEGKRVLLYDDMIMTGGTTRNGAKEYLSHGARSVVAVASHAVFPNDSPEQLKASGVVERVIVTNTNPRALELAEAHPDFFTVVPIQELILDAARNPDKVV